MKLGIFIENKGNGSVDLSSIEKGNPGIGGTEYEAILAMFLLVKNFGYSVIFYSRDSMHLRETGLDISVRIVDTVLQALELAKSDNVELFFLNKHANTPYCSLEAEVNKINELKINCVTIGQCFYSLKELDLISKCKFIKRNLYVSRQLANCYLWHNITKKSEVVYNMVNHTGNQRGQEWKRKKYVTYVGSLVGPKSFHVLAQSWKKVLESVPDAELHVIGSGKLYSRDSKLGKYNIADEGYENYFMQYLTDADGNILPSVNFHGVMNAAEMMPIFDKTAVGVVNPTGLTETFCISGVEMQAFGIPLVSKRYGGLIDTISDEKTGLLVKNESFLSNAIVKLLEDTELNQAMGNTAVMFAKDNFSTDVVMPVWNRIICEIKNGEKKSSLASKKGVISFLKERSAWQRPELYNAENIFMPSNNYKWIKAMCSVYRIPLALASRILGKIKRIIKKILGL